MPPFAAPAAVAMVPRVTGPLRAGDTATLTITSLSAEGDGVGEHDGLEVVVPGLFPGEVADVRIDHRERQRPRAYARPLALHEAHPGRRPPPCPRHAEAHGRCTGCPWQALDEASQRDLKARLLRERFGLEVDRVVHLPGGEFGYRRSSKRVVAGAPGALLLGSHVRGTHRVADMDGCMVEDPTIAAAAAELAEIARDLDIAPFDEKTGQGDLRYVWFKSDGRGVLVTLITAAEASPAAELLPARLQLPVGVAWSVQGAAGNQIRGGEPRLLRGRGELALTLAGVPVEPGPLGFLQPNPEVAALAYQGLLEDPDGAPLAGDLAYDLYAGAGVTTALLRRAFAAVLPCESFPESAARLGVAPREVADFLAERLAAGGPAPALVVANPPRAGLGAAVCERLLALAPARLHLMSCGPAGLARDLDALRAGGYRLLALRAYDTLPQTAHVEVVAWLAR